MSLKSKGISGERELIHLFWENGWAAIRVAGSGSMQFPSPDLLVGNRIRKLAIECKVTKEEKKYFSMDEIKQIKNFSEYFGCEPWIAVKFLRFGWYFINPEDLKTTDSGYVIGKDDAERKALRFEELVSI